MLPARIEVALRGDLEKFMKDELRRSEKAVKAGISAAGAGLKDALRAQVVAAGLGQRLAKAWRHEVYPTGKPSLSAAASVFSKAPHIHTAFDRGETIRSPNGVWLAIPTENAPKKVGRKRITPSNFPEHIFGPLRFVFIRGQKRFAFLVVDKVRKSKGKRGGFRKATEAALKRKDFEDSVAMFVLVPDVKQERKTNLARAAMEWEARIPGLIDREFEKLEAGDGGSAA